MHCSKSLLLCCLLIVIAFLLASCDNPLDGAVKAIDEGLQALILESGNWRKILEETRDKILQETIRNDVDNILNRAIAATSGEFRCDTDFVGTRISQELKRLKAEILNQPVPEREPFVCNIVPDSINALLVGDSLLTVTFYGYDFDAETPISVLIREFNGNPIPISSSSDPLSVTTHYKMTLTLGEKGVPITPDSDQITLKWKNKVISEIAITHPIIEPPEITCDNPLRTSKSSPYTVNAGNYKPNAAQCPSGYVAKGIDCTGNILCNEVVLLCCPYIADGNKDNSMIFAAMRPISPHLNPPEVTSDSQYIKSMTCGTDHCATSYWNYFTSPAIENSGNCAFAFNQQGNKYICENGWYIAGARWKNDGNYYYLEPYCCKAK